MTSLSRILLSPQEVYHECVDSAKHKTKYTFGKLCMLTIIGGAYVGLGATTCFLVGGLLRQANPSLSDEFNYGFYKLVFGAVGFPMGFTSIMICGAELYTSICAYTACGFLDGKISILQTLKLLIVSWCGNFIGCLLLVGILYLTDIYDHGHDITLIRIATDKVSLSWGVVLMRGIMANWLVGIATWMANSAQDLTGKAVAIWLPISAFAMIGYEHCIANQYILVMAVAQGANLTFKQIVWNNLVPSTIGNWIGGAIFVGAWYSCIYGNPLGFLHKNINVTQPTVTISIKN